MREVAKLILNQKEINKALFVSVAIVKTIIGYLQEINTNVNPVNSEPPYAAEHYCISLSYLTTIGILE